MKPRIGITMAHQREVSHGRLFHGQSAMYAKAVCLAGGVPVWLPPFPGTEEEQLLALDGVLFSGGVDVDPEFFGAEHEAGLGEIDSVRDTFELELYRLVRLAHKPVLGICRGSQLINVAEGGTLHQHIPKVPALWADHSQTAKPPALGHRVSLVAGTVFAALHDDAALKVNSHHHQGVRELAPTLQANALAPDGLVEGFEGENVLALQWHPELLFELHPVHLVPFVWLVTRCQEANKPQANMPQVNTVGA